MTTTVNPFVKRAAKNNLGIFQRTLSRFRKFGKRESVTTYSVKKQSVYLGAGLTKTMWLILHNGQPCDQGFHTLEEAETYCDALESDLHPKE